MNKPNQRDDRPVVHLSASAWELPGYAGHASLPEALQQAAHTEPVFNPEAQLGKKGLRYKETATLLALCAARQALLRAGLDTGVPDPAFGVVVACNTGNLDTVCNAVQTIRDKHINATSSMDLPNASSNVVASTVAIRFGLQALNLMICSGSNASFDALVLAANAIRNGRAERMLVIGVETDGPALRRLLAAAGNGAAAPSLLEGALAVVLESAPSLLARGAASLGTLGDYAFVHSDAVAQPALQALMARHAGKPVYPGAPGHVHQAFADNSETINIAGHALQAYGMATLLQLVHHLERGGAGGAVIVGGGTWQDRRAGVLVVNGAAP